MNLDERIKGYKAKLKELQLEAAKQEERERLQKIELEKLLQEAKKIDPEFTLENCEQKIMSLEKSLKEEMDKFDAELESLSSKVK